jgi:hypothetical protein
LSTGRRTLVYAIALIGLLVLLASLLVLCGEAIRLWSPGLAMTRVGMSLVRGSTAWIGLALAGVALWALGWLPANRAARQLTLAGAAARSSAERKAYLYVGQLVTLAVGLTEAGLMAADLLRHALELPTGDLTPWPSWALTGAASALVAFSFWGHLRWVTVHDGDFGREFGRAANWRRTYFYLVAAAGFALVIGGAIGYLRAMLGLAGSALQAALAASPSPIPAAAVWREPIVWSVTALVIGIPVAILIWNTAGRLAAGAPAREYGALSRVTLLHAGLLFGTAATLLGVGYLLWQGLLLVTSGGANTNLGWPNLIMALVCLPVGVVSWLAFASGARHTVALSRFAPRAIAIRRFTLYLLAAASLAAFWFGLGQLSRLILSGAADPAATGPSLPAHLGSDPSSLWGHFSLGAALVLVGAPAWWGYWWPRQVRARQAGSQGADERSSVARKAYLYGIIAAGAIALSLSLLASALQAARGSVANAAIGVLSGGVVALFWLITHLFVLRGDRRREAIAGPGPFTPAAPAAAVAAGASSPDSSSASGARSYRRDALPALAASAALFSSANAPRPVIVIDGGNGSMGSRLLAALHRASPKTSFWPLGLNPNAQAVMLAALGNDAPPALPSDALAKAIAVVGPSDMLLPGGLGGEVSAQLLADLAASPARLVLLPPRDLRLRWVAAPEWPEERWIENAVIEVTNVLQ